MAFDMSYFRYIITTTVMNGALFAKFLSHLSGEWIWLTHQLYICIYGHFITVKFHGNRLNALNIIIVMLIITLIMMIMIKIMMII